MDPLPSVHALFLFLEIAEIRILNGNEFGFVFCSLYKFGVI